MATHPSDIISASEPAFRRRWRIPPPYLRGSEPMEGVTILEEVPGALGLLLWQAMRDVTLWAMTPKEERVGLFNADAEPRRLAALLSIGAPARDVEAALRATASMLTHPADIAPEAILTACQRISQWAEVEGAPATALAFAQAAAMAVPASAKAALRVGRLARQRGEYPRAEGWIQRSIVLARQSRERETHAWGYTALGQVYGSRGNFPLAERCHLRALRISRRFSLISREAAALHDLFVVTMERGRFAEALAWARSAAKTYGPLHSSLPYLANDVATLWMEQGRFDAALPVLVAAAQRIESPRNVLALANVARAAGGAGDRARFESTYRRVLIAVEEGTVPHLAPTALLNLAKGAAALGETSIAADAIETGTALARQLGENKTTFQFEALLASMHADRRVVLAPVSSAETDELTDVVAGELVAALTLASAG